MKYSSVILLILVSTAMWGQPTDDKKYAYKDSLELEYEKETDLVKKGLISIKLAGLYYMTNPDSARIYYERAYGLGKLSGDLYLLSESTARIAESYVYVDAEKAIKWVLESIEYAEQIDDPGQLGYAHSILGTLYRLRGELDNSRKSYNIMLESAVERKDSLEIARAYNNIGIIYMMNGDYDEGLEYWKKALELKLAVGQMSSAAATMANIAIYYKDIGRYLEAKDYLEKALEINKYNHDLESIAFNYTVLGDMHFKMENYPTAIENYFEGLKYVDSCKTNYNKEEILRGLSGSYEMQGNFRRALEYQRHVDTFLVEKFNENNTRITKELTTKYETDKKEQENLLLKTENDAKDAKIQEEQAKSELQKTRNLYLVIGLSVVFAALILIVLVLRRVRQAKMEIEEQKHLVEEKNNEILDSIGYAKRLQEAILPPEKNINAAFKNNFVLYLPKDIVAGDFYWMQQSKDRTFIAAADCTGHGVPGAMVSVVCHNALNRAVREFGITNPGEILDKVTDLVIETFEQGNEEVKDGMDICICSFLHNEKVVEYAGANNGLYHISNSELIEIRATKQPVGKYSERKKFETNIIPYQEGDSFYMFTDGYADQFGGEKGKKLKYKNFKQLLLTNHKKGMIAQRSLLEDSFEKWRGELEQIDDVCVIGIRV